MLNKKQLISVLVLTSIFTLLFNNQWLGLNVLIFELIVFVSLFISKQLDFKKPNIIYISIALITTAFAVVFVNSILAIVVNFIICILFIGILLFPEAKSLINSAELAFLNAHNSQSGFFRNLINSHQENKNSKLKLRNISIFLIPFVIIIIFIAIYSNSNPVFQKLVTNILDSLNDIFSFIFKNIDFVLILTIITGLIISNSIFFRKADNYVIQRDISSSDYLQRIKKKKVFRFRFNGLKNEFIAAVFLLFTLNVIILILNMIDIYWVWFNFSWNGDLLKQFVHEGTYLLIFSIIISIVIVLYYFRGNLNFFTKNKWLKYLSYIWLFQNAVLTISVGVRNFWYIYYYSLAYKRIGVIFFLILTIYGLYTVYIKVKEKKSAFYLIRSNIKSFIIILIFSSLFNWDTIIARYNFANKERAYVHFQFLSNLSFKALPYLEYPKEELKKIESKQDSIFPLTRRGEYISSERYAEIITEKKLRFKAEWETKGILSWNYPEYKAYKELFQANQ